MADRVSSRTGGGGGGIGEATAGAARASTGEEVAAVARCGAGISAAAWKAVQQRREPRWEVGARRARAGGGGGGLDEAGEGGMGAGAHRPPREADCGTERRAEAQEARAAGRGGAHGDGGEERGAAQWVCAGTTARGAEAARRGMCGGVCVRDGAGAR
nr:spidroin-1-like [Aegilops tauschii subsp. strangulata]